MVAAPSCLASLSWTASGECRDGRQQSCGGRLGGLGGATRQQRSGRLPTMRDGLWGIDLRCLALSFPMCTPPDSNLCLQMRCSGAGRRRGLCGGGGLALSPEAPGEPTNFPERRLGKQLTSSLPAILWSSVQNVRLACNNCMHPKSACTTNCS
jgi:hypothetical protein